MEERDEANQHPGILLPEQVNVVVMDHKHAVLVLRIQRYSHAFSKRNHTIRAWSTE